MEAKVSGKTKTIYAVQFKIYSADDYLKLIFSSILCQLWDEPNNAELDSVIKRLALLWVLF
jgi:hypothetical protein